MAATTVSIVIPTRNRSASLHRLLTALGGQRRLPDEVIVSDSSDSPLDAGALSLAYPNLRIMYFRSAPSVCGQRNAGIRRARGTHILLCDDDVEPPPDYIERLVGFLERHPDAGAVSGVWCEPDGAGRFSKPFSVPRFRSLLIEFVAQRSIWGDVEAARGNVLTRVPLAFLKAWYRYRGNTWSLSGWPLLTQVQGAVIQTAVYTLGSALIRKEWLLASPYDERAGPHGAGGDNYNVALGFPGEKAVNLLTDVWVRHHRERENRLDNATGYYHRTLFLHHLLSENSRFSAVNRAFLVWTLTFNAIQFLALGRWEMFRATAGALRAVLTGRNPLFPSVQPAVPSNPGPSP